MIEIIQSNVKTKVSSVRFGDLSMTSTKIKVRVKVTNENPVGFDLSKIVYDIYYNKAGEWKYLGTGKRKETVSIRKNGQTTVTIPTEITNQGILKALLELARGKGEIELKVDGSVFVDLKVTSYEKSFEGVVRIQL